MRAYVRKRLPTHPWSRLVVLRHFVPCSEPGPWTGTRSMMEMEMEKQNVMSCLGTTMYIHTPYYVLCRAPVASQPASKPTGQRASPSTPHHLTSHGPHGAYSIPRTQSTFLDRTVLALLHSLRLEFVSSTRIPYGGSTEYVLLLQAQSHRGMPQLPRLVSTLLHSPFAADLVWLNRRRLTEPWASRSATCKETMTQGRVSTEYRNWSCTP